MAAFLSAYWKVSNKRFLDSVPQTIALKVLNKLGDKVAQRLLSTDQDLPAVFRVSDSDVIERAGLVEKKERLIHARELLLGVQMVNT